MIVDELKRSILNKYFNEEPHKKDTIFVKFDDVVELTSGQDLTSDRYFDNKISGSIPYLTGASNLQDGNLIINRYTSSPTSIANKNDILLTCKGTIGEIHILEEEKVHIARQFMAITCKNINLKYMFYYLKSQVPYFISEGKSIIPGIKRDTLLKLNIPLPSKDEQQKIVSNIEKLFFKLDKIKPLENELSALKLNFANNMKKSILKNAFDGKYSAIEFCDWKNDKLINVCDDICTGNSISENVKKTKYVNLDNGYNYIGTKDLNFNHSFEYENGVKIPFDEPKFKYANVNDILLCIEGGSAGKKIGILKEKVCYGNKLCKFSSSILYSKFLYYFLQSPQFIKNFHDNISGIIGGVSINKIKSIRIDFPPIEEQQRIVDKIEQLLPLCDDIENLVSK